MRMSAGKWAALVFMVTLLGLSLAYAAIIGAVVLFDCNSPFLAAVAKTIIWPILVLALVCVIAATTNAFTEWSKMR